LLAARVVERILSGCGGDFRLGWVTPHSSDGGADFVGRLDIGSGFSRVKQVVFGQAKCERIEGTTSGTSRKSSPNCVAVGSVLT